MLTIHRRSIGSSELLKVGVEAAKSSIRVDITTFPVSMAVKLEGTRPVSGDYQAASWETIDGVTYASAMVGPGGIALADTDEVYIPWVKVVAGAQTVEIKCFEDVIEVY